MMGRVCLMLKIQIRLSRFHMKNYDLKENNFQSSDPVEKYFECISYCDITDGICFSKCVEILKEYEN